MVNRRKRKTSCYSDFKSSSKGLDVTTNYLVKEKLLKLSFTLGEEEAIVDMNGGVGSSSEDPNYTADLLVESKQLKLNIPRRREEGISVFSVGPLQGSNCKQGDLLEANSGFSFQSTHSYHLCGEDNQSQQPNGSNTSDSKWPSLPALVLWMIKDKLDIFDDMRLSAVCRDWLSASKFYPHKLSVGDGLPWIMQKTANKTEREFISITRKTKFTINLPEFSDAVMLSSKNGWFLMKRVHFSGSNGRVVFLINPFTKAKINLPSLDSFNPSLGSFSTCEGHPRCIVLLRRCNNKLTIRTACSGDDLWNEWYYIEDMRRNRPYLHSLIIDENVYCFDKSGEMLVCNMTTLICLEVPGSNNVTTSIMEFEGDLVRVDYTNELSFFRYNDAETSWQKLDSDVLKDMSWFLRRDWCFCSRTQRSKAYSINPRLNYKLGRRWGVVDHLDVVVDDLVHGGRTVLDLPYQISQSANWVDIG